MKKFMACLLTALIAVTSSVAPESDRTVNTISGENSAETRIIYLNLDMSCTDEPAKRIFYAAHRSRDGSGTSQDISGKMKTAGAFEKDGRTWPHMMTAEIPADYDQICFSSKKLKNTSGLSSRSGVSELFSIPDGLEKPCLYLDNEDPSVYEGLQRGGIWMEAGSIRNPEREAEQKNLTLTEIPEETRTKSDEKRYLPVSLYDNYSDQELNGIPAGLYGENGSTARSFVPFRVFDMILSEAYRKTGAIPLYTGHFQPDGCGPAPFSDMASALNLFGWDNRKNFFAVNNSLLDADGDHHPQNYASAAQGLVSGEWRSGQLMDSTGKGPLPYFDENFLRGANSGNLAVGKIYSDVAFPFTRVEKEDGTEMWTFDSARDHVHLMKDAEGLYLGDPQKNGDRWSRNVDSGGSAESPSLSDVYGFFPFNDLSAESGKQYNFGFGAKIDFDFCLPEDGILTTKKGKIRPVTFTFSGDDDVWVFIDGKLALDVGGDHGKVEGDIDFHDCTAHVSSVKKSRTDQDFTRGPLTTPFEMDTTKGRRHRLTMYYLERGMWESNLKIEYSLSPEPFEPTPAPTETPKPTPTETPAPESKTESVPTPESTKESVPETIETSTPESAEEPFPASTVTPTPQSETEQIPEPEEAADSIASALAIADGQSEEATPADETRRRTGKRDAKPSGVIKTKPVATGDFPLKAVAIPIISGLVTLYAYLRRKHKK